MARVVLTSSLRQFTDGVAEIELEVSNVRQLMRSLGERYPQLAPHLDDSLAVAIDGEIFQDAWFAPIGPDSEVHLMPRIGGG